MLRSNSLPTESVGKEWCSSFGGAGALGHVGGGAKRGCPPSRPRGEAGRAPCTPADREKKTYMRQAFGETVRYCSTEGAAAILPALTTK